MARYEPELLGCYRTDDIWYSSLLEYLALLVNGESQRMPLPRGPLNEALASTRLFFGTEAIEYRSPTETRAGAMLGIKEYPTPTVVGMYDRLLSAPLSFVLTQSFAFLTKSTGQGCCSGSSIAWPMPATSPCRRPRSSRTPSMR